jgi:hypothetical protein
MTSSLALLLLLLDAAGAAAPDSGVKPGASAATIGDTGHPERSRG